MAEPFACVLFHIETGRRADDLFPVCDARSMGFTLESTPGKDLGSLSASSAHSASNCRRRMALDAGDGTAKEVLFLSVSVCLSVCLSLF